jgi:hypothetical protein
MQPANRLAALLAQLMLIDLRLGRSDKLRNKAFDSQFGKSKRIKRRSG